MNCVRHDRAVLSNSLFNFHQSPVLASGEAAKKPTREPSSRQPFSSKSPKPTYLDQSTVVSSKLGSDMIELSSLTHFWTFPEPHKFRWRNKQETNSRTILKRALEFKVIKTHIPRPIYCSTSQQCIVSDAALSHIQLTFELSPAPHKFRPRNNQESNSRTFLKTALQFKVIKAHLPRSIYGGNFEEWIVSDMIALSSLTCFSTCIRAP